MRIVLAVLFGLACVSGCSKKKAEPTNAPPTEKAAGGFVTVGTFCDAVCGKLCGDCGDQQCPQTCKPRCLFNRSPEMPLDGKDPKVALAKTQQDLDACLGAITHDVCPKFMAGDVPPVCFTIQH